MSLTDSTVLLIKNITLNSESKTKKRIAIVFLCVILTFDAPNLAQAKDIIPGAFSVSKPVRKHPFIETRTPMAGAGSGQNPSGGNSNPSSGSNCGIGYCSANPNPRTKPHEIQHGVTAGPKTKKQRMTENLLNRKIN